MTHIPYHRPFVRPQVVILYATVTLSLIASILQYAQLHRMIANMLRPAQNMHQHMQIRAERPPSSNGSHASDCSVAPCLALTFDDGPNPITTPRILDVLKRQDVHATFFVIGKRVAGQGPLLRRMYQEGNEIGNHSWGHPDMSTMTSSQVLEQVNLTQTAVATADVPAPRLFRPPYGAVSTTMRGTIPLTFAMWNVDPADWQDRNPDHVKERIIAEAKPGGVLDLHDIYDTTAQALEPAITELKKHYTLVTYSQLFGLQAGQRGEYFGR